MATIDGCRVGLSSSTAIVYRNGLRWHDAPAEYGPHKTLCNRWKRWSDKDIFARTMAGLAANRGEERTVAIDATYPKAHRIATSWASKRGARSPDRLHGLFVTAVEVGDCIGYIGAWALPGSLPKVVRGSRL